VSFDGNPARVRMAGEYVGLLVILVTTPNLHGAACRFEHRLFDAAALGDPLAIERAVELCSRCPARTACAAWASTLSTRQRAELGVVAGIVPAPPVNQPEQAVKAARQPAQRTKTTSDDRLAQRREIEAARAVRRAARAARMVDRHG
jgi:hypothetical protein